MFHDAKKIFKVSPSNSPEVFCEERGPLCKYGEYFTVLEQSPTIYSVYWGKKEESVDNRVVSSHFPQIICQKLSAFWREKWRERIRNRKRKWMRERKRTRKGRKKKRDSRKGRRKIYLENMSIVIFKIFKISHNTETCLTYLFLRIIWAYHCHYLLKIIFTPENKV